MSRQRSLVLVERGVDLHDVTLRVPINLATGVFEPVIPFCVSRTAAWTGFLVDCLSRVVLRVQAKLRPRLPACESRVGRSPPELPSA